MRPNRSRKFRRFFLITAGCLALACLLLAGGSALANNSQPTRSQDPGRLSEASKAHIAEVTHLRQSLGEGVWPGWGEADIPVVLFNEERAFLAGVSAPPDGWRLPLKSEASGGQWQPVQDDLLGAPYFRQPVKNADRAIGNFTVQVGDHWAAALGTQEWNRISFRLGFYDELPPVLREVFPYGLAYRQLFGRSDVYLTSLEHEAFHAYQGEVAPERLVAAERAAASLDDYPWDDKPFVAAWRAEMRLLRQAVQAGDEAEARRLGSEFLAAREVRRQSFGLSAVLVNLERQREWLEGLAKYAELRLGLAAATSPAYRPIEALQADPGFKSWAGYRSFYNAQINQMDKISSTSEVFFYYSGMGEATLLDRLAPDWKAGALQPGAFLEDLLEAALQ